MNTEVTEEIYNQKGFYRFNKEYDTCPEKLYESFIDGFLKKFQDSFFFINLLQCFLVSLMYSSVGKGVYWEILFFAAVAGCIGGLIESGTIAYICRQDDISEKRVFIYPFFLIEICWIIEEYSIPLLNFIKIKGFSKENKVIKIMSLIIYGLLPFYCCCRLWIGYNRMNDGILQNEKIQLYNALSFAIIALANLACIFSILYSVKQNNIGKVKKSSSFIKYTSYTIIICVDAISIVLSIFNAIIQIQSLNIPKSLAYPIHCIECSLILILSFDALIFKYEKVKSSNNESGSNNKFGTAGRSQSKSNPNNQLSSVSSTSYLNHTDYQNQGIIKNYLNTDTPPTVSLNINNNNNNTSPSLNFGFLNSQNNYDIIKYKYNQY